MKKMPVYFIGHGSPMNALETNSFTKSLKKIGEECPKPKAILCISAHWMTEGTWILAMKNPRTIHDFYGFPKDLFDVQYKAPGDPKLANHIISKVTNFKIHPDDNIWGLDHGTWSVLKHMYPEAKIPVIQLSLNMQKDAQYHFELGKELHFLREEGVLILGSGNLVHNLGLMNWDGEQKAFDWANDFDNWIKGKIELRDFQSLQKDYHSSKEGKLSIPTMEHYLPLMYVVGASEDSDVLHWEFEGIQNSSISMRTFRLG